MPRSSRMAIYQLTVGRRMIICYDPRHAECENCPEKMSKYFPSSSAFWGLHGHIRMSLQHFSSSRVGWELQITHQKLGRKVHGANVASINIHFSLLLIAMPKNKNSSLLSVPFHLTQSRAECERGIQGSAHTLFAIDQRLCQSHNRRAPIWLK